MKKSGKIIDPAEVSADNERLLKAVNHFKNTLATERLLDEEVEKAINCAHESAQTYAQLLNNEELLKVELNDNALCISTEGRSLTLAAAHGAAIDTKLPRPRGLLCRQILVFALISGQESSTLLTAFRVYADGVCSTGSKSWNIHENDTCMKTFLGELIAEHLFESDLYWPELEAMPEYLQALPVTEGKPSTKELSRTCIGFECLLEKRNKTK